MRTLFFLFATLTFILTFTTNTHADPTTNRIVQTLSADGSYFPKGVSPFIKIKYKNTWIDSKDVAYCRYSVQRESFPEISWAFLDAVEYYLMHDVFAKKAHNLLESRSRYAALMQRFLTKNVSHCGDLKNKKAISFIWQLLEFPPGTTEKNYLTWLMYSQRVNFVLDKNTRKLLKIN